jgi:Flp pilus assembly protein TadD
MTGPSRTRIRGGQKMSNSPARNATKRLTAGVAAIVIACTLSACANKPLTTGSIARTDRNVDAMSAAQVGGVTASVGKAYAKNPKDKAIGIRYAELLQMDGKSDQALAVMRRMVIIHPNDRDVQAAYGKSLAAAGELKPALEAIRRAQTPEYPDWRLLSAEAAILDQLGDQPGARTLYRKALDIKANEPSILSNLGMSYVLEGDLKTAETYLRSAIGQPGADSRVRQNLALVVGLQGRFDEAEQIAGQELSPEQAQANITYLRQMLQQQNAWGQLKEEEAGKAKKTN